MRNGHYALPPLRAELQAAHDEMDAKGDYFAYAVCRTHDGQAWEVTTRQGGMYAALDGRYLDHDEAAAAAASAAACDTASRAASTSGRLASSRGRDKGNCLSASCRFGLA